MTRQKCVILIYVVFVATFFDTKCEDFDIEEDIQELSNSREVEGNF